MAYNLCLLLTSVPIMSFILVSDVWVLRTSLHFQVQVLNLISVLIEHVGEKIIPFASHLVEFFHKVCLHCSYLNFLVHVELVCLDKLYHSCHHLLTLFFCTSYSTFWLWCLTQQEWISSGKLYMLVKFKIGESTLKVRTQVSCFFSLLFFGYRI